MNWRVCASVVLGVILASVSVSSAAEGPTTMVGHGRAGRFQWAVNARPERRSICLEVVAYDPRVAADEEGRGQCSYPSPRRGILLVTSNRKRRKEEPKITVIGAALNPVIKRVVVVSFDGARVFLRPRSIGRPNISTRVRDFRYLAFAVRGVWCAQRVITYDSNGHRRWSVGWKVLDPDWRSDKRHSPNALCPH